MTPQTNFNPKVSIIIPVYNGSNYMKEAIDSALAQTYNNIEIIVVNDGSNDEGKTKEIALGYGSKIRYFEKENGGVATALNMAIKNSTGDYISWLSHDDVYYPNKVERQIQELSNIQNKNTIIYSDFDLINAASERMAFAPLSKRCDPELLNIPLYPLIEGVLHGCSMLINKELFSEFGYFKPELRTTQDYDLWFLMLRKYPIRYIDESLIKSRYHDEQGSKNLHHIHKKEGNDLWIKIINELTHSEVMSMTKSSPAFFEKLSKRMIVNQLEESYIASKLRIFSGLRKNVKNILITSSVKHGGLNRFTNDLSENLTANFNVYVLHILGAKLELSYNDQILYSTELKKGVYFNEIMAEEELSNLLAKLLILLDIDALHIHGFIFFGFSAFDTAKELKIPVTYTAHDFHTLCVSQHFLDNKNNFCGFNKDINKCYACLKDNPSISWLEMEDTTKIRIYREYINKFILPRLDMIIFPTNFTKDVFGNYLDSETFNKLNYKVIENGVDNPGNGQAIRRSKPSNKKTKIAILGSIYGHKGLKWIEDITQKTDKDKFEFFLFGECKKKLENTIIVGKYHYSSIVNTLKSYNISITLILSNAPETYSYTLSESWLAGIPAIATNLGAQKERVEFHKGGWVVGSDVVDDVIKLINDLHNNPQKLALKKSSVGNIKLKTCEIMALEYGNIYSDLIDKSEKQHFSDTIKKMILKDLFHEPSSDTQSLAEIGSISETRTIYIFGLMPVGKIIKIGNDFCIKVGKSITVFKRKTKGKKVKYSLFGIPLIKTKLK